MSAELIDAAKAGALAKLRELKLSGADMAAVAANGSNALHYAAQNGHLDCVKFLVHECGLSVATVGESGHGPVYWAVHGNHSECAKFLLASGAKIQKSSKCRKWAIDNDEVSVFLNHNAGQADLVASTILELALSKPAESKKYTPSLSRALDMGAELTPDMFEWSIIIDNRALLERLFAADMMPAPFRDAQISTEGYTLIQIAARHNSVECLQLLLARSKVLIDFVNRRPIVSSFHTTAIKSATSNGHSAALSMLLAAGANPKHKTSDGYTALHCAAYNDSLECAQLIVKHDPTLMNMQDCNGNTALHIAAYHKKHELIEFLVTHGADKTIKNDDDETPLHRLLRSRDDKLVKSATLLL